MRMLTDKGSYVSYNDPFFPLSEYGILAIR